MLQCCTAGGHCSHERGRAGALLLLAALSTQERSQEKHLARFPVAQSTQDQRWCSFSERKETLLVEKPPDASLSLLTPLSIFAASASPGAWHLSAIRLVQ